MKKLKGSEKQVKWAESIRNGILKSIEDWREEYEKFGIVNNWINIRDARDKEKAMRLLEELKKKVEDKELAEFFIENRFNFRTLPFTLMLFNIKYKY